MRLTLVTFSGASESDQESIIMSTAGSEHMDEEEIDESLSMFYISALTLIQ